ncbi:MAG TPA: hypothetical protein VFJ19_09210 [Nocardioidaceae bacterium]|nr:hypothetical protein [Nocardioidaceae bacterium]
MTVTELRDMESVVRDLAVADGWPYHEMAWDEIAARLRALGVDGADLELRWDDYRQAVHDVDSEEWVRWIDEYPNGSNATHHAREHALDLEFACLRDLLSGRSR